MNEESLFAAALERPVGAEREAFLAEACGADAALRQRVEQLLAADEHARGILERGPDPAAMEPSEAEPALASGRLFAGRFKLRQKLGEGGMGEVWVADQIAPVQRRVALKVVRPGLDSERMLARFDQERQALALMDHPNIAKVLDAGVSGGQPYFVMELIKGVPITRYCDEAKLSPRERLELFIPVCHAVQHAHQKGIIHRDLKPSNIVVGLYDGKPIPKVIDFGVAKATGPRLTDKSIYTEVGTLIGTLEYMSPEQAELNNLDIDTRSDIYTLGTVLYELLTGGVPFSRQELQAAAFTDMLRIIKEVDPPKPSTKLSGSGTLPSVAAVRHTEPKKLIALIRGELDWIVVKCLEKDRARRYETANGLARDLERYLADEPVVAGPPSPGYRLRKFMRRHRRVLLAASAFGLLVLAAVVTLSIALIAVNRARQEKEAALKAEARRRAQARAALDTISSQLIEDWLVKQQALLPEHKRFLEQALHNYEEFAADTGQEEESRAGVAYALGRVADIRGRLGQRSEAVAAWERSGEAYAALVTDFPATPAHRQGLAQAHLRLGGSYKETGQPQLAEQHLNQAQVLYGSLASDFPDAPVYRLDFAKTLVNRALLLDGLGRAAEAEEVYDQAQANLQKLAADFPAELEYRKSLAQSYVNQGVMHDYGRRKDKAEKSFRQAVAICEQLVVDFPTVPDCREVLAMGRNDLANVLQDGGRHAEAEEVFRQALVIRKQLAAEYPAVPEYRRGLAITLNNLGILYKNTNRQEQAEELYSQAATIHKQLASDFPTVSDYQNAAAGALVNLARLLLMRHDLPGARRLLEEALPYHQAALKASPQHAEYRRFYRNNRWRLAETLLELKDHAAAAQAAGQFLQAGVELPRDAYTAACLLAGCARLAQTDPHLAPSQQQALSSDYGNRALTALRHAIDTGFKDVAQIQKDANLDALRAREDFQRLVTELASRRKP